MNFSSKNYQISVKPFFESQIYFYIRNFSIYFLYSLWPTCYVSLSHKNSYHEESFPKKNCNFIFHHCDMLSTKIRPACMTTLTFLGWKICRLNILVLHILWLGTPYFSLIIIMVVIKRKKSHLIKIKFRNPYLHETLGKL